jgi:hypothetical protein
LSLLLSLAPAAGAGGPKQEVGEFDIPLVVMLDAERLARLRERVAEDPRAAAVAERVVAEAQPALARGPEPLAEIHYEGLVHTDPRRVETVASLNQMGDIARLLRAWQATGDAATAEHLRRLIAAWAETYRITGNDVNENKLVPLLIAYASLRPGFDPATRDAVDGWVEQLGELHARRLVESNYLTNRFGKHLRITAICARILGRAEWQDRARAGAQRMIANSLRPNGGSFDLEHRDSLGYHGSAVRALIEMSLLLPPAGEGETRLYDWEAPSGASIRRSVDFVLPYARGEKVHREWVNTKVQLDRDRAAAGLEQYQPGRAYEPRRAVKLLEVAAIYDPSLGPLVAELTDDAPSWMGLVRRAWWEDD